MALTDEQQRDQADYSAFKSTQNSWRELLTSWMSLSIRSHSKTSHLDSAAITKCVKAEEG